MNDYEEVSDLTMLPSKPLVSVLMLAYNHEPYIEQAIQSIVSQITDFTIELIISEDCSTDATRTKAFDAQRNNPHLIRVVYSEKNVGVNRNYQRALSLCRGDYIANCEGDDYWQDQTKLQQQVDFLEKHTDFVGAYHNTHFVDEYGNVTSTSFLGDKPSDYTKSELLMTARIPTQTFCHRNVLGELPPEFFFVVGADYFLISLLGNHGKVKYINSIAPSAYRQHAGGIWSSLSEGRMSLATLSTFYWLSKYYRRIGNFDISNKFACSLIGIANRELAPEKAALLKCFVSMYFQRTYKICRSAKRYVVRFLNK